MKQFFKDFEDIEKEFEIPKRQMREEKFPEFVIRKPGKVERRGGFSISFSSDGINPPKIEMRRFGPSGKWEKVPLEKKEIIPIAKMQKEKLLIEKPAEVPEKVAPPEVEEKVIPGYNVSVDIKEVTITLNAEGVESKENVEIKFYPESVEIYAVAPKLNKGYFCTVAIPTSVDKRGATIEVKKDRVIVRIPRRLSVM
ncbi:MAG: hypothetical protein QMD95_03050 [Candidatus Hodarchaeaceae archaeon]|nr:hypothetical protein [Candidatus Hodarchaeaceae archaeon]